MRKKHPKALLTILVAALLVFALAACGSTSSSNSSSSASGSSSSSSSSSSKSSGNGKTLVVYFSGTGNTERVAKYIADATNADTFEIEPSDPYTEDDLNYNDSGSRVVQEYQDESKQDIALKTTTPANWDSYDTVFFGYPIWWGDAAWPVNNFAKNNDFSGKTVIPFCTSFSSGIGDSGDNLKQMANNTGNWQSGHRFAENASKNAVTKWVNGLDLD